MAHRIWRSLRRIKHGLAITTRERAERFEQFAGKQEFAVGTIPEANLIHAPKRRPSPTVLMRCHCFHAPRGFRCRRFGRDFDAGDTTSHHRNPIAHTASGA